MDTFILRFLLSTIVVSSLVLTILLTKKILYRHMSKKTHYKIWYFLFIPFITSFLPGDFFRIGEIYQHIKGLFFVHNGTAFKGERISGSDVYQAPNSDLLHDFTISVNNSTPDFIHHALLSVWIIGMILFIGVAIYANYQLHQLKKSAAMIKNQKINEMLEECKEVVGVKKRIKLRETPLITSPVTLGILQPYILLPKNTRETFSLNELKYVFLHELSHQKNKDVFVNYAMWVLQIIYWFNPLVWYAFKRMRIDRELACDASVLHFLDESRHIEYGFTIIRFAEKKYSQAYGQFASGMGGTKEQIKQRIQSIAGYSRDSLLLKWKSKGVCTALGIFVLCLSPLTTAIAVSNDVFHFSGKNTVYEDLSSYFNGYSGSFVLYDAATKNYQIYNREMSEQRISPNSTYKIYSALFSLEENVISVKNNEQHWDGTVYPFEEWNKNHDLSTALGSSVNWYFQNLDQEIGKKQLQYYFHKIKYGNENLSGKLDSYWMESSLKISPIEQVQLLTAFEENSFGFKEENVRAVKNAIFIDEQKYGQLYGKTGTGMVNGKNVNGWFVGFVKHDDNTYYPELRK
ncbi:BlaR1 family beta-lactam sensor/signal transducer [Siminovitchia fortis]|uniref:BlaR1 family beta-lactam sensor/signal transducer n=1 Tax=Siminovitchia fortis TaxID=254758 RepID=A0A443IJQ2_9BACI|nr:BlaR1 family beta-lactam sensor/signal transducer [Siminovitchia fortis]RWR04928.1 BlaR1 family beta-lactam sensor/signal transducer [Siminovitchia fortis]WHY82565.1 BlaR1 family beta-lactam sensor/signal transducer [Siminovitchia fortis]